MRIKASLSLSLVVCLVFLGVSSAQQTKPLSQHGAKIKRQVDGLTPGEEISVIRIRGSELFATFTSENADSFVCENVDAHVTVHLTFDEVGKVKRGYGSFNTLRQKHTDHVVGILAGAAVIGGIFVVLLVAKSH